jgi:hypothetical protein
MGWPCLNLYASIYQIFIFYQISIFFMHLQWKVAKMHVLASALSDCSYITTHELVTILPSNLILESFTTVCQNIPV